MKIGTKRPKTDNRPTQPHSNSRALRVNGPPNAKLKGSGVTGQAPRAVRNLRLFKARSSQQAPIKSDVDRLPVTTEQAVTRKNERQQGTRLKPFTYQASVTQPRKNYHDRQSQEPPIRNSFSADIAYPCSPFLDGKALKER